MSNKRPTIDLLRRVPMLSSLTDSELQRVIDQPENVVLDYAPHEVIFTEGDTADCLYIVLAGSVDVRIGSVGGREITIATLKEGDFFGEQALMPGATGRRNATVRGLTGCSVYRVSARNVSSGLARPEDIALSGSHGGLANDDDRVRMLLRSVRLFRSLSAKDLERVEDWTDILRIGAGDIIIREQEPGDCMYVVLEGSVEVFAMDDDGKVVVLGRLTQGQYFGEQALLPGSTGVRNANVRAATDAILVRVAKRYVQAILNHDNRLLLALRAVGDDQIKQKAEAIGRNGGW